MGELLDPGESLDLYAANGEPLPYDGWVELTVNLTGNDNPNLEIQVPFLVSQVPFTQPLLGSNILREMMKGQASSESAPLMLVNLLQKALGVKVE